MADCEARRLASQELHCLRCGLRWDADDPEPPTCPRELAAAGAPPKPEPIMGVDMARGPDRTVVQKVTRASLTERLTALCERMRAATVLPSLCDDLEDMIVEVGVIEAAHRANRRTAADGPLPPNVVPIGR